MLENKFPHKYVGPDLPPRAGGVMGIKKGMRGKIVHPGPTDENGRDLVEFMPTWGQGWVTFWLPANEVIYVGGQEDYYVATSS